MRAILPAVITIAVVSSILGVIIPREHRQLYVKRITEDRENTDAFMKYSADSPIPASERSGFEKLDYYPVDSLYRVNARIERIVDAPAFSLLTTGDTEDPYERFAWAYFSFRDGNFRVLLLRSIDASPANRLFLAFTDSTGGADTYAGGRYLNLFLDDPEYVTIDFNKAYNPYCVYDPSYICPLPPFENDLGVGIEAGERMYRSPTYPNRSGE